MAWHASIRVVDQAGEPRRGAKVTISFADPGVLGTLIGTIDSQYTDSDGWAYFEYDSITQSEMSVDTIWVDGEEVDSGGALASGQTRSYTV